MQYRFQRYSDEDIISILSGSKTVFIYPILDDRVGDSLDIKKDKYLKNCLYMHKDDIVNVLEDAYHLENGQLAYKLDFPRKTFPHKLRRPAKFMEEDEVRLKLQVTRLKFIRLFDVTYLLKRKNGVPVSVKKYDVLKYFKKTYIEEFGELNWVTNPYVVIYYIKKLDFDNTRRLMP